MALIKATLTNGLTKIFAAGRGTPLLAAEDWVNAYVDYAKVATGFGVPPVITDDNKEAMRNLLETLFKDVYTGSPSIAANGIATALTAFWFSPITIFAPVAYVSLVSGTAALVTGLTTNFISRTPGATAASKALEIATLIDTFTRTVVVTNYSSGLTMPIS